MSYQTQPVFIDDAYETSCEGKVLAVNQRGGIILDRTNFYATSGGQPGDTGRLELENGRMIDIVASVFGETKKEIVLVAQEGSALPRPGERVNGHIDWARRLKHMQMHSACHILSVVCPFPITGARVGENDSRVDFDLPDASLTKQEVTARMMAQVEADHPIFTQWITETQLDADPSIVRSKNVRPPRGLGRIRLVCIGENSAIDSQPCGGTHVRRTGEIGQIHIGKIEKKGAENRRFRIRFGTLPKD